MLKDLPDQHPLGRLEGVKAGDEFHGGKVEAVRTIDGRPAAVIRRDLDLVLYAADDDRTYEFKVMQPQADPGGARARRFFDSVRISRPVPSAGGAIEAIPVGWDRVALPRTQLTVLMPQGQPLPGGRPQTVWTSSVYRSLVTPEGVDYLVGAAYLEAERLGPPVNMPDPIGGVRETRPLAVGGYPATLEHRVLNGTHTVGVKIDLGGPRFIFLTVAGANLGPSDPVVKRVLDSASFTLRPKRGRPAPVDYAPQWVRRFGPNGFSVELPGQALKAAEAGVGVGPVSSWAANGLLPRARGGIVFTAGAVVHAGLTDPPNPWVTVESDVRSHATSKAAQDVIRRAEFGAWPGHVRVKSVPGGRGEVLATILAASARYTVSIAGDGITPDSPEVKRCLDSVSFAATPADPNAKSPDAAKWERRGLEGSGFSAEIPPGTPPPPPPKSKAGAPVVRTETGELNGKDGVIKFTMMYVGKARATDPGPPPSLTDGPGFVSIVAAARKQSHLHREVLTASLQGRPSTRIVSNERGGGPVTVRQFFQEGDRVYSLQVEGVGISTATPEVLRFLGTARFDDPPK